MKLQSNVQARRDNKSIKGLLRIIMLSAAIPACSDEKMEYFDCKDFQCCEDVFQEKSDECKKDNAIYDYNCRNSIAECLDSEANNVVGCLLQNGSTPLTEFPTSANIRACYTPSETPSSYQLSPENCFSFFLETSKLNQEHMSIVRAEPVSIDPLYNNFCAIFYEVNTAEMRGSTRGVKTYFCVADYNKFTGNIKKVCGETVEGQSIYDLIFP